MQALHHKRTFAPVEKTHLMVVSSTMGVRCPYNHETGFSLIELMVSVLIGLILLAGLMSNFITQSRVEDMQANYTQRMGDLHLASQFMQHELRTAQSATLTWAGNTLSYTNIDGNSGFFQFFDVTATATGTGSLGSGSICWSQPVAGGAAACNGNDELIRGLNTASGVGGGMDVQLVGGVVRTIALKMDYQNNRHQTSSIDVAFKIWPRN